MRITSLFQKTGIVLYKNTLLKRYKVDDNLYYVGKKNINFDKILLYFPNPEFMHLGDHFFFEPLAQVLSKNFRFKIMPTGIMEFYFRENSFYIAEKSDIPKADLIITRTEFLFDRNLKNKNVLYLETAYPKILKPICEDIVLKVIKFIKSKVHKIKKNQNIDFKPEKIKNDKNILKKLGLNPKYKYILFNNYIDSGGYIVGENMYKRLDDFTSEFAEKNNLKVIHVGTAKEKQKDNKIYNFVDYDLRGKTTPKDIFDLAACPNIICNISFDAFQMHVFFIYGKKNYILFRGRLSKTSHDFIVNYVNPPFPYCDKKKIIEYIN